MIPGGNLDPQEGMKSTENSKYAVKFHSMLFLKRKLTEAKYNCGGYKICRIKYMTTREQRTLGVSGSILFIRLLH